jgi:hypothetical protein
MSNVQDQILQAVLPDLERELGQAQSAPAGAASAPNLGGIFNRDNLQKVGKFLLPLLLKALRARYGLALDSILAKADSAAGAALDDGELDSLRDLRRLISGQSAAS